MAAGIPLTGADELRAALCGGRGVLASYCHLGPFAGIGVTIAEHAGDVHQVIGPWLLEPQRGPAERRRRAWLSMFDAAGVPMIVATGCFPAVLERLRSGAVVVMAFDWPGSTETMFLGRPAMLVSGTARLAVEADALVVPVARSFRGLRLRTVAGPPLDPRRHSGWRDLHAALAARHGRWILERPGALEDPAPARRVGRDRRLRPLGRPFRGLSAPRGWPNRVAIGVPDGPARTRTWIGRVMSPLLWPLSYRPGAHPRTRPALSRAR